MKKITALGLLLTGMLYLHAQVTFPDFTLSDPRPSVLRPLFFRFDINKSAFKNGKQVRIFITEFSGAAVNTHIPLYTVKHGIYRGGMIPRRNTALVLFSVKNAGKPYQQCKTFPVPVYGKNGRPIPAYYPIIKKIMADPEAYLFDPEKDMEKFFADTE